MKFIYQLFRVACFIVFPLFFQQEELTPQPIKNMLLAFLAGVVLSEISLYFISSRKLKSYPVFTPLVFVAIFIFPYKEYIGYFVIRDRLMIYTTIVLSVFYLLDRKWIYPKFFK